MATRVDLRNNAEAAKNPVLANARDLMVDGRWQNEHGCVVFFRRLKSVRR